MAKHGDLITDGGVTWKVVDDRIYGYIADTPNFYSRSALFIADNASNKTTIITPDKLLININNHGYMASTSVIDLNITTNWDQTKYATQNNRVGMDFYIYAVEQDGDTPKWVLSSNSTCPSNSDSIHSRKVGGFHCLCADPANMTGHPLASLLKGQPIPNSIWDLRHRPLSDPEGMVWVEGLGLWVDIYLNSWSSTESRLVSTYGGTIADGSSTPAFHGAKFIEELGLIGKRLPMRDEFSVFAKGSNEGEKLSTAKDPVTTGGHASTSGKRTISNYGIEDCCGVMEQYSLPLTMSRKSTVTTASYNATVDGSNTFGYHYATARLMSVGEHYSSTASLVGSRSFSTITSITPTSYVSARGVSEPVVYIMD